MWCSETYVENPINQRKYLKKRTTDALCHANHLNNYIISNYFNNYNVFSIQGHRFGLASMGSTQIFPFFPFRKANSLD